jgi:hypothetical protein
MNQRLRNLLGISLLLVSSLPMVYSQSLQPSKYNQLAQHQHRSGGPLIEEFSFLIKDFKIDHQAETNNLNISISYRYVRDIRDAEYPDFRLLAKDVEMFLTNYPNEKDYWEILNKQITSLLLKKYPAITSVTSELKVDPSRLDPYIRSSRVTREREVLRTNRK